MKTNPQNKDLTLTIKKSDSERKDGDLHKKALDFKLIFRLFTFTQPYKKKRTLLFILVFIRAIQLPLVAWAISAVINGPIMNRDPWGILWGTVGFGLFALFTEVIFTYRMRTAMEMGEAVVRDLRTKVFQKLMKMPLSYFNRTKLGRIISHINSDIEAVRVGVQDVFFVSLVQGGQMLGSGILMLYYNWVLFLIILVMAPLVWLLNRYFRQKIGTASRELQESMSRVTATLAESVKGIKVTQGFSRENVNAGIFNRLLGRHADYNIGFMKHIAIYIPLLELNSQFFMASILMVGGYGVLTPGLDIQIGDLIAFFFLANLFFSPIPIIGWMYTRALASMAGGERIFKLLDQKPDWEDDPGAIAHEPIVGKVKFDKVFFEYDKGKPILEDISFSAEPGKTVALVGHTGSGKSTIINLVSKFYVTNDGLITIDDVPINKITSESLHSQMGIVLQQNFLFSGTVRDNIRLGNLEATDNDISEAARQLDCLDLIEALPNGFDTRIGEQGTGISLGQRQLICFTRAFLANPRILILDEATSSVDTMTEARLQNALVKLLKGRTCFVVAHRLSTIRNADLVLVMDHGKIVERGNHTELLKMDGIYAHLYSQFIDSLD